MKKKIKKLEKTIHLLSSQLDTVEMKIDDIQYHVEKKLRFNMSDSSLRKIILILVIPVLIGLFIYTLKEISK